MKLWHWLAIGGAALLLMFRRAPDAALPALPAADSEVGVASFYGPGFHGNPTANGEKFDQNALTAAHRTLPFNTKVRVTDLDNGRSVVVRINDRGPFTKRNGVYTRSIDLSVGAAAAIGLDIQRGLARVKIERLT